MISVKYFHVGIDGTGTPEGRKYETKFTNSFVSRIHRMFNSGTLSSSVYLRGPSTIGWQTPELAVAAADRVANTVRALEEKPGGFGMPEVYISGYSRGGHAALLACELLKERAIPVKALFLFDAVDMSRAPSPNLNSRYANMVFHAIPDQRAETRPSWKRVGPQKSRGNGTEDVVRVRSFYTTHGGIGGNRHHQNSVDESTGKIDESYSVLHVTKVTVLQELSGSSAAWSWMNQNVRDARSY